jgi:hypothetical protein
MRLSDDDSILLLDALAVYYDTDTGAGTSATVEVKETDLVLTTNLGANTIDLTAGATDTLGEVVTAINAINDFIATLLGISSADAATIVRKDATSCYGQANEVTLEYETEALIELLIQNIWAGIETHLGRNILSTSYSEIVDRPSDGTLVLKEPEVTSVTFIADAKEDGLTVEYTGSDEVARVEVTDSQVTLISRTGATTTTTAVDFATYVTTDAVATQIALQAGWTASVVTSLPSAYLVRRGAWKAKDTQITLEAWDDSTAEYEVEYGEGLLRFDQGSRYTGWPLSPRFRVDYVAGYATIPGDVEQALLEAVKVAWDAGSQSAGVKSERIGDYAYELSDVAVTATEAAARSAAGKLWAKYGRFRP